MASKMWLLIVCFCLKEFYCSQYQLNKVNWLSTVNASTFALYSHQNLGTVNILLGGCTIRNNACA